MDTVQGDRMNNPIETPVFPCAFRFDIDDEVIVRSINARGRITQRCDRGSGRHDYQTVYWLDGERRAEWLLEWELSNG